MLYREIRKGDLEDQLRIENNFLKSNNLLKLLITIYDQKKLALKFNELGGEYKLITREKLNRWKSSPESNPIVFNEKSLSYIEEKFLPAKPSHWDNPTFEFIDLFAGIGGIRKGFEDVGGKCTFTCEWDVNARRTYLANHYVSHDELPYFLDDERENSLKNKSLMDITKITRSADLSATEEDKRKSILDHIPHHDVLLAGFPCQPFSLAGVSKKNSLGRAHGFECETQGTLFFDVEQILKVRQPKFFVLENVKNLKSHDKGKTFSTIIRTLDKVGYWIADISNESPNIEDSIKIVRDRKQEPTIIDGVHFTPQHRERIVLVGVRKDLVENDNYLKTLSLKNIKKPERKYSLSEILCQLTSDEKQKYTLTPNLWNYLYHYALKHASKGNGFGFGLVNPANPDVVTRTLSARYYKDGSEILINQSNISDDYLESNKVFAIKKNKEREGFARKFADDWKNENIIATDEMYKEKIKEGEFYYDKSYGRYAVEFNPLFNTPRRLTPRECARLMGFEKPEFDRASTDKDFNIVCTDTSAYKQFGNSVVVPVFRSVAELLKDYIKRVQNKH